MKNYMLALFVLCSVAATIAWDAHCNPLLYVNLCHSLYPTDDTSAANCCNKIASICEGKKSGHHCDADDDYYNFCTWTICGSLAKNSYIDNCANYIFKVCHQVD